MSSPVPAIRSCAPALRRAVREGVFDAKEATSQPVAVFFDLDVWDAHLSGMKRAFGPTFKHAMAMKSCSVSKLLAHAKSAHGLGAEAASIGELLHALEHIGFPPEDVVFDSPARTFAELKLGLERKVHTNLDNFEEFARAERIVAEVLAQNGGDLNSLGPIGFRLNPLVGAGTIAALSVSTSESKFGVPVTERERLLECYAKAPWMNSVHVHVGSGGMGAQILGDGIRVAVDFALEVNTARAKVNAPPIKVIDIGGGLPANYGGDDWAAEKVPTFEAYAEHLRKQCPELFSGQFTAVTEFGQSIWAKVGFLASRIEWRKGPAEHPIVVSHIGADLCPRQVYTSQHARRIEVYKGDGTDFSQGEKQDSTKFAIAGPLCFQGDFIGKDIPCPSILKEGDIVAVKDCGANTLSMFSRHCSRLAPPVYGFRGAESGEITEFVELKARETREQLSAFWGGLEEPAAKRARA